MQTPSAEKTATICLIVGMTIWLTEILLRQAGKLTMHQFEVSMLIPIAISAYGAFARGQSRTHGL